MKKQRPDHPRIRLLAVCIFLFLTMSTARAAETRTSALWGREGEAWTPESRLPDFSYAGYHCGEQPLPTLPPGVSVKDFGAKGDGIADDSQAFLDALAKAPAGVIEIPAGRYKITRILEVRRSGLVLRGAGPDKTILFFPTPLNEIRPDWGATTTGNRTSNYSWSGGFIWFMGNESRKVLANVTAPARRGGHALQLAKTDGMKKGDRIELAMRDSADRSLTNYLYSGDPGDFRKLRGVRASFVCRVTGVNGGEIQFDRPLRCDVRPEWAPQISAFAPSVRESGVENLCFEFPNTPYKGHFTELGFNAVAMSGGVADCWVRNVHLVNADSGFFPGGHFNTIQGVVFESARATEKERGATGHHGIYFEGDDILYRDFDYRTKFMHDITVARTTGNVSAHGRGVDFCFDHHKYAPYENLFTDIDAGEGTRLWQCGGGASLGKNCGAHGTFWNIRARRPLRYPPASFGPASLNLVGLETRDPAITEPGGKWFEAIPPASLEPQDLHAAQLARRLGGKR